MGFGDDFMSSGHVRELQQSDARKVRIMHGSKVAWSIVWDGNPRIAHPNERGDFQIFYARSQSSNMRPYHRAKSETKWTYELSYRARRGEIYLTDAERKFAAQFSPDILLSPWVKANASPNKNWIPEYWRELVRLGISEGFKFSQFQYPGAQNIPGVGMIQTPTFRHAVAVLERARGFVSTEGGTHHAAGAVGLRGVVVMGGFTPVSCTSYPEFHRSLGCPDDQACGMRLKCAHCESEMKKITPEIVLKNLMEILKCPKPTNPL